MGGGGTETLVLEPIGADFYNQAITGGGNDDIGCRQT